MFSSISDKIYTCRSVIDVAYVLLQELENMLEEGETQSIQEYVDWFETRGYLTEEINAMKSDLDSELVKVKGVAQERVQTLDRAAQRSQDNEKNISAMEVWIGEVNNFFRDWNDQDMLAGDLPEEFKVSI